MVEDDLHDTIDSLYAATVDPRLWLPALSRMAECMGGVALALVPIRTPTGVVVTPGLEEATRRYVADWHRHDTLIALGRRLGNRRGIVCDWEQLAREVIDRDPFYQEFRRPNGLGGFMGVLAEPLPGELFSIGLQLVPDREPPGAELRRRFEILGRHAVRALAVATQLAGADPVRDGLAEALGGFGCGAAVIDRRGTVLVANREMERRAHDGLRIVAGRIEAARAADQRLLDGLLRTAFGDPLARGDADVVALSRPGGKGPLLVRAAMLPRSAAVEGLSRIAGEPLALVLIVDPARREPPAEAPLRRLGLTAAEARVAARVGVGMSPREAAASLEITEGTARVLLKRVFGKLGVSRQSELALLVGRTAALAATPAPPLRRMPWSPRADG